METKETFSEIPNTILKCIAIDDEPFALEMIADDIQKVPYLELVNTFSSPFEAWELINSGQIDLVFLDIQMPTLTGTQFLRSLIQPPMVIFTTAYQQYAMEGYDLNVIDYLLKPIPFDRFLRATNKAYELYTLRHKEVVETSTPEVDYVVINADYKKIKLFYQDILFVEGLKDYVKIFTVNDNKPILTRSNLKAMEGKLPAQYFCRVHNSYIVSLQKITAFQKSKIDNFVITTNEKEKNFYIKDSILTISKSGTITLDICKNQCPLIVVYKTSWLNYLLIKPFINTKFGNILNIIAQKELIPELIQGKCNTDEIYKKSKEFIDNDLLGKKLVTEYTKVLETIIVPDSLEKISNYVIE